MADEKTEKISPKKTLALCIIAKDEEKSIAECINSVKDYIDEIILVDSDSKDRTAEVAEKQGAKIFNFKWVDDFSAARNFCMEKASTDWILMLDADEVMAEKDIRQLKQMIQSTAISAFQLIQRTYTNNSDQASWRKVINNENNISKGFRGYFDIPITRLFVNNKNLKFTGRVHEDITPSIKENKLPILKSDFIIHHYEYSKGDDFNKQKQLYYLDLSLKKIKDNPDDPKAHADAGIIYYNYQKNPDDALIHFRRAIDIDPNFATAYNYMAKIYMDQGKKGKAINILNQGIKQGIKDDLAYFNLAKLYIQVDKPDQAIDLLKKAAKIYPARAPLYQLKIKEIEANRK